jgi:NAD(P)-dependent dehydrogenase (short-subunit alcohol dehydrogenase family)
MTVGKYNEVAIVTGADGGVSFAICQRLLKQKAHHSH